MKSPANGSTSTTASSETIKVLRRIASLSIHELPVDKIADIVGINVDDLYKIYETKEYRDIFSSIYNDELEQQEAIKDGWDGVEALAISQVLNSLQGSVDQEYALRAAMVANRAQRRSINNRPLNARPVEGKVIVFQLRQTFVQQINDRQRNMTVLENKQEDGLNPKSVEKMFMLDTEEGLEYEDMDELAQAMANV